MAFDQAGNRDARLPLLVDAAGLYLLDRREASDIVEEMADSIRRHWADVCDAARLAALDAERLWGRQFLNPHPFRA